MLVRWGEREGGGRNGSAHDEREGNEDSVSLITDSNGKSGV